MLRKHARRSDLSYDLGCEGARVPSSTDCVSASASREDLTLGIWGFLYRALPSGSRYGRLQKRCFDESFHDWSSKVAGCENYAGREMSGYLESCGLTCTSFIAGAALLDELHLPKDVSY